LSLAICHITLASSCNMIYCSRQYSPIFMQWPYIVIHLGVLVSHGWATMPGWSGISWWQLRDNAKYFRKFSSILISKTLFLCNENHIALSCHVISFIDFARECNMIFYCTEIIVIHLGVLVSHGWATMPGWSGISWWQLRDNAKYHMRRNTLFYFIT
jgi:hypothetical protein